MLFFRYQPPGTLNFAMLRRGEIFFASPSELNDAHEFRPQLILKGSEELWQRLAHYILLDLVVAAESQGRFDREATKRVMGLADPVGTAIKKRIRSKDLDIGTLGSVFSETITPFLLKLFEKSAVDGICQWLKEFISGDLPKRIEKNHYVACFALNAINPMMWGHYANAERGFVLVYTTENNKLHVHSPLKILHGSRPSKEMEGALEIGSYADEFLDLKSVRYRRNPPKVNAFYQFIYIFHYSDKEYHYDVPDNLPADAAEKEEDSLGLIKFSEWKYEREIRAFLPQISFTSSKCEKLTPDVRVLRVSGEHVSGLIFGPKMSEEDKQRALTCCYMMRKCQSGESNGHFAFFQAEQQHNRYHLGIRPVGILDETFYRSGFSQLKPLEKLPAEIVQQLETTARAIMEDSNPKLRKPTGETTVSEGI